MRQYDKQQDICFLSLIHLFYLNWFNRLELDAKPLSCPEDRQTLTRDPEVGDLSWYTNVYRNVQRNAESIEARLKLHLKWKIEVYFEPNCGPLVVCSKQKRTCGLVVRLRLSAAYLGIGPNPN